jgi:pyruvate-ferredoxin/flavodoxin oxidoreductase
MGPIPPIMSRADRIEEERVSRPIVTVEGNEATAYVAHRLSEVIAIYPITPSSGMGEMADAWSSAGQSNVWGVIPEVVEMQSEGGAAGACHGAIQAGALTTTFTASQGLLLMLPNMYKIAGELSAGVIHVAARTVATHALSIFGDHSDVMGARQTGFALLASSSVQEAQDMAAIAHAATLRARVPFLHFFDGFRTSHEVAKIERVTEDDLRAMIDMDALARHRLRAMDPEHPVLRGTAQNPDVFFQAREASNPFFDATPGIVQEEMDRFAGITGRQYRLFDYVGAPDAEHIVVLMGSGVGAAREAIARLVAEGEKVGALIVRLYRPFDSAAFLAAMPETVRTISVLDRTKEPGATGEPMYQDVLTAVVEATAAGTLPLTAGMPRVVGGRYGLSSKEFTPAMVNNGTRRAPPKKPQASTSRSASPTTSHTSASSRGVDAEPTRRGSGPVLRPRRRRHRGRQQELVKIIGEHTAMHAQGYFVYDSKKSGAMTVSHLRFGPNKIHSTYLIDKASFVACHQFGLMEKVDVLGRARRGCHVPAQQPVPQG